MPSSPGSMTRVLLLCGAVAGPLFVFTVLVQDYTRYGFDPRVHLLSLLSLGDWGWIQVLNFVGSGVLNVLYAIGLRRRLHPGRSDTAAPVFIAAYGIGLVAVGIFTTDPAHGFPPGAAVPTQPSWHGAIHALGGLFVFLTLAAALIAFARLFQAQSERGWALSCLLSAVLVLVVFFGTINSPEWMARGLRLGTLIGWMAVSIVAVRLLGPWPQRQAGQP
jgi:Protein of unknown function (DUF998)